MHRITVGPIDPDQPMSGCNTRVEMDGVPLKAVTKLSFTVGVGTVATVHLDMLATVEVDGVVRVLTNREQDEPTLPTEEG